MPDDDLMNQDEIERLLGQADSATAPQGASAGASPPADTPVAEESSLEQDQIEQLLAQSQGAAPESQAAPAVATPPEAPPQAADGAKGQAGAEQSSSDDGIPPDDVEYLINQAERALESIGSPPADELPEGVAPFELEEFAGAAASSENATLDLVRDVELDLKIELGRTYMYLEDVLKLRKGSVVPLDKLAGDPVDIFVNGRLVARGEVLVLNDNFCVRVAELIAGTNASA